MILRGIWNFYLTNDTRAFYGDIDMYPQAFICIDQLVAALDTAPYTKNIHMKYAWHDCWKQ